MKNTLFITTYWGIVFRKKKIELSNFKFKPGVSGNKFSSYKYQNSAYFYSGKRSSKQTTGVKKLMNDSQELTVENFNDALHDTTIKKNALLDSNAEDWVLSSRWSHYCPPEQTNDLKIHDLHRDNEKPTKRPPIRLSDRMTKLRDLNSLDQWIPTQSVGSPESITSKRENTWENTKSIDHRSIYLLDLRGTEI